MNSKKEVQHVYLVGAKSLGAYVGLIDVPDEVKEKMGHPKNRKK